MIKFKKNNSGESEQIIPETIRKLSKLWYKKQPSPQRFFWVYAPQCDKKAGKRIQEISRFLKERDLSPEEFESLAEDVIHGYDHTIKWVNGTVSCILGMMAGFVLSESHGDLLAYIMVVFVIALINAAIQIPDGDNRKICFLLKDIHTLEANRSKATRRRSGHASRGKRQKPVKIHSLHNPRVGPSTPYRAKNKMSR